MLIQQAAPSNKHETQAAHNKLLVKLKKLSGDCMKLLLEMYKGHENYGDGHKYSDKRSGHLAMGQENVDSM